MPGISLVIPIKNGKETIQKCLEGWLAQKESECPEIIVIDSGSTDGSVELAKEYPVKLIQIPPDQFNHGDTRNLGAAEATGDFVLFTVQDAWTTDRLVLERMAQHFKDPEVVGVCGQQIVPHDEDKNPVAWFRSYSEPVPRKYQYTPLTYQNLPPEQKAFVAGWDDVIAMYRKSYLLEHPFEYTNFSEDLKWANHALADGKALVFDYRNRVNHYHHENFNYRYRRQFIEDCQRYWIFGLPAPPLSRSFSSIRKLLSVHWKAPFGARWWVYNFRLIIADLVAGIQVRFHALIGDNKLINKYHQLTHEVPQGKQYVRQ